MKVPDEDTLTVALDMLTESRRIAVVSYGSDPIRYHRADAATEAIAAVLDRFGYEAEATAAIRRGEEEAG